MMTELFTAALITDGRAGLPRSSCCRCATLLLLLPPSPRPGPGGGGGRRGAPLEPRVPAAGAGRGNWDEGRCGGRRKEGKWRGALRCGV